MCSHQQTLDINYGCAGIISEDTALPYPYRAMVGIRQCRVVISDYINSNATGFDINRRFLP